ncbi:MAG: oligopeptide transporter, OPT family, partial [Candidatus Eremiobacteraeota bacterium]|nr:oligopeptide transporter, OPT family [Candidatus Eremiobacteraeota bacterium]
ATISNDNLQDLKTGQLVEATPWRQQVSLIVGVFFGAIVIPPVLQLLNRAYGFGAPPAGATNVQTLPAPQATLISALAKGVVQGQIDWSLIGIGVLIGIAIIAIDEAMGPLSKNRYRLPPLAVGLGIYLPPTATAPAVLGAVCGSIYNRGVSQRPDGERAKRLGVLVASGLIVGESLMGVIIAGIIVANKGKGNPLAVIPDSFARPSMYIGGILFAAAIYLMYRFSARLSHQAK